MIPVAIPTSDCGTDSTIRLAMAASANVMPAPSSDPPTMKSHGCAWDSVMTPNAEPMHTAPRVSMARSPKRPASGPATGPASNCAPASGAISRPEAVGDMANP